MGVQSVPARQGELSPETKFILDRFGFKEPLLKTKFAGEDLFIVDYSDLAQAPKDIKEANLKGIVDHHKLGDITTPAPLECCIKPVGCSNTVIKELFDINKVKIPKNIAGIMLCAILSDTVIYKSPTCTATDIKVTEELAKIAGINDIKSLGMEMFLVKSAVKGANPRKLLTRDYKDFVMNGNKIGVGQLEVVDLGVFDGMRDELLKDMKALKEEGDRHSILLLLTDIMNEGSELLVMSDNESIIEKAFGIKLKNHRVWLPGVLSRKKQIIPFLEKVFS
jgi:manganese-dependent inorganic pyrophosphatase